MGMGHGFKDEIMWICLDFVWINRGFRISKVFKRLKEPHVFGRATLNPSLFRTLLHDIAWKLGMKHLEDGNAMRYWHHWFPNQIDKSMDMLDHFGGSLCACCLFWSFLMRLPLPFETIRNIPTYRYWYYRWTQVGIYTWIWLKFYGQSEHDDELISKLKIWSIRFWVFPCSFRLWNPWLKVSPISELPAVQPRAYLTWWQSFSYYSSRVKPSHTRKHPIGIAYDENACRIVIILR
jgi:hypothetical protein